ncbi:unnamed protein product [Rhodiola kirilowii]
MAKEEEAQPQYFTAGTEVEVSTEDDGFRGSWFAATVITPPPSSTTTRRTRNASSADGGSNKVTIEYKDLMEDEQSNKPVRETLDVVQIRPVPPREAKVEFKMNDFVDAYYNDGWWEGVIVNILESGRFEVYFRATKELLEFGEKELRIHREWGYGNWNPPLFKDEAHTARHDEKPSGSKRSKQAKSSPALEKPSSTSLLPEKPSKVSSSLDKPSKATMACENPSKVVSTIKKRAVKENFGKGSVIEVKSDEDGFEGAWFSATVLKVLSNDKFFIEYKNLKTDDDKEFYREEVGVVQIRPVPPREAKVEFKKNDFVDAYYNDGWWEGVIVNVSESGRFEVYFMATKELIEFGAEELRIHREWVYGDWNPPLIKDDRDEAHTARDDENPSRSKRSKQSKSSPALEKSSSASVLLEKPSKVSSSLDKPSKATKACEKPSKVVSTIKKRAVKESFGEGSVIEVKNDEDGFEGAWFSATVLKVLSNGKFFIEYKNLKTDDDKEFYREEMDVVQIRPVPPREAKVEFKKNDFVDAYYNDGWWEGVIVNMLEGRRFKVYFRATKELIEFGEEKLRIHREWVNGDWNPPLIKDVNDEAHTARDDEEPSRSKRSKQSKSSPALEKPSSASVLREKPSKVSSSLDKPSEATMACETEKPSKFVSTIEKRAVKENFVKGSDVEVKSDEDGFQGAWFSATVLKVLSNDKFLIEYKNLKTDDDKEFVKEEVDILHIRPAPPDIMKVDSYRMYEEVDASYSDGWWAGVISKVYSGSTYLVFFRGTNEELKFDHSDLRVHQEWIDGKWTVTFQALNL